MGTASGLDATPLVALIHVAWWRASSAAFGRKWKRTPAAMMVGSKQHPSVVASSLTAPIRLAGHPVAYYVVPLSVDARVWTDDTGAPSIRGAAGRRWKIFFFNFDPPVGRGHR